MGGVVATGMVGVTGVAVAWGRGGGVIRLTSGGVCVAWGTMIVTSRVGLGAGVTSSTRGVGVMYCT